MEGKEKGERTRELAASLSLLVGDEGKRRKKKKERGGDNARICFYSESLRRDGKRKRKKEKISYSFPIFK